MIISASVWVLTTNSTHCLIIFLFCKILSLSSIWNSEGSLIKSSWYKISSPVLLVANQTCSETEYVVNILWGVLSKKSFCRFYVFSNYSNFRNSPNLTRKEKYIEKSSNNHSWILSKINFWPNPNMWNSVYRKLLRLKFFHNPFCWYLH